MLRRSNARRWLCTGAIALAGCSIDLSTLQRTGAAGEPSTSPATDPGGAGGAGSSGAGSGGAGSSASGAGASAGSGGAGTSSGGSGGVRAPQPAGESGAAPVTPQRTCGVTGLPCCMPGNTCDLGACLRGKCTAYGGFYSETSACTQNPCISRNTYTAGCNCPLGFDDTLLWKTYEVCDAGEATTEVRSCTAARTPETIYGGAWVEGPDANCTLSCRTANPVTGECGCPNGTDAVALTVDVPGTNCPNTNLTLRVCINAAGKLANFGGAYALSQSAALGCSAANPLTNSCSCPEGVTMPQSLHVGSWSVFVCNL